MYRRTPDPHCIAIPGTLEQTLVRLIVEIEMKKKMSTISSSKAEKIRRILRERNTELGKNAQNRHLLFFAGILFLWGWELGKPLIERFDLLCSSYFYINGKFTNASLSVCVIKKNSFWRELYKCTPILF